MQETSNQQPTSKAMTLQSTLQSETAACATYRSPQQPSLWRKWLLLTSLGGISLASPLANAQWTTTDDFQLIPGMTSYGFGLGTSPSGSILAVGSSTIDAAGTSVAVARQCADLGLTWQPLSAVNFPGATWSSFRAVASDGQTLYAGGDCSTSSGTVWFVAQSTDGGDTWGISDSFQLAPNQGALCSALVVDSSGNVFASGSAMVNNQQCFIIRKLPLGASSWSTVYQAAGGSGFGMAIHPTAGLFAVGYLTYGTQPAWAVLRSIDDGNTWAIADLYPAASGSWSHGRGIGVDSHGNLYTTGIVGNTWTTRRSMNAGASWTITDTFYYTSKATKIGGYQSGGYSVSFDYLGNVYVAGYADVPKGGFHWTVRKLPVGGSTWSISDDFQLTTGQDAYPSVYQASILSANSGHLLLVTGYASTTAGGHWITRRLVVP
jgi:hypothetical protein